MTGTARIERDLAASSPAFTRLPRPASGAPNVVLIVLDDLGFAQLGCFGSDLATPNIDRLAAEGLRYRRFHVTSLCSPTRASLVTGRNHHAVGMGFLSDIPIGYPGYDARIPRSAATLPRILRDEGYNTFAVGKWHLTPRWEANAAGPFDRWPLGLGFERYYGFLDGDTNQWTPGLVRDNGPVDPPRTPEEGYHLTEDLADTAIRFVRDQQHADPGKPFFLYFAPGATHAPHQVPAEWIERHRGAFDDGWEAWRRRTFDRQVATGIVPEGTTLTDRPSWVPAWDEFGPTERALFARYMEAFAGFLSHTDAQIGRVLDELEQRGILDNTLVLLISDNGASAEGGPTGQFNELRFLGNFSDDPAEIAPLLDEIGGFRAYNHYPWGWAWAGNTPFPLWKRYAWLGGVRTPLVVRWPTRITDAGAVRDQFCHAIDVLPTVLEALGVDPPETVDGVTQQRIDGASLVDTFVDADAPSPRDTQYFEMMGSRSIYHNGWKATTDHISPALLVEEAIPGSRSFDEDTWKLFNLQDDFAEAHDLAADEPERVEALVARWWREAGANQVLPIEDGMFQRFAALQPSPWGPRWKLSAVPGAGPIAEEVLPPLLAGFRLSAQIWIPEHGEGVIAALGDWHGGWALYLRDGAPVFTLSLSGDIVRLESPVVLDAGTHEVEVVYEPGAPDGQPLRIGADGVLHTSLQLARPLPVRWQIGGHGLHVGLDVGFPVDEQYATPFPFTGEISEVLIEVPALAPEPAVDLALALRHE